MLTQHMVPGELARSLHLHQKCVSLHTKQLGSSFFCVGMATAPVPVMGPFQGQRTLQPGMRVRIGAHLVTVSRFLSSGGFAQVYLVEADVPVPIPGHEHQDTTLVLKHMCVWNKDALASVRGEVEYHRELRGHESIVHFVEASAASLVGDGWEIFILMEYCAGGGLIDYLNTRLQHRLREDEVLRIFRDVCEGVLIMHHQDPVLVHRDIKIENVLRTTSNPPRFKLCDFGSCFPVLSRRAAKSAEEIQRCERELNQHTTMQYRAPEMIDLGMQVPITEKADIWALGVFLYKLCYYTTPFEAPGAGPAAILQARFEYPAKPPYSDAMRALVQSMLQVRADARPSIDSILENVELQLLSLATPASSDTVTRANTLTPKPSSIRPVASRSSLRPRSIPKPASATTPPPTQKKAARSSERPDSLILNVSLDDVVARYPSLQELDQAEQVPRKSVKSMVQQLDNESPPCAISIPMEKSTSDPMRDKPAHTLVDVDLSSSDEENEAPEDVNVRIRPRSLHPHRMNQDMSPAESVHTLLEENSQGEKKAAPISPPPVSPSADQDDELATLAEHEKALRQLLGETRPTTTAAPRRTSVAPPPPKAKPASLSRRQSTAHEPRVGQLLSMSHEPTPSPPSNTPNDHSKLSTPKTSMNEVRNMFEQASVSAPRPTVPAPKRTSLVRASTEVRRSSTWDVAEAPTRTYVNQGTSPGLPSTPVSEDPVVITGTNATVAKSDAAASVDAMLAHQRDGHVRLTKPVLRDPPIQLATKQRAFPVPESKPATSPPEPEPEQPFTGVSALIHKWQTQT